MSVFAWLAARRLRFGMCTLGCVVCAWSSAWSPVARAEAVPRGRSEQRVAGGDASATALQPLPGKPASASSEAAVPATNVRRQKLSQRQIEELLVERRRLARERRDTAIAQLETFVHAEPEIAAEMPDALLRLAELRWEEARERQLSDYEAWQKAPERVRSQQAPTLDVSVALGLYERILTKHKDFERLDVVLYMKAYALLESERMSDALDSYKRILEEFPNSRFRPDAQMAFAEAYFGRHDFAGALERYSEVMRFPDSELADLALFKSAWCLWKLGREKEAARRFREVLDLDGVLKTASAERKKRLSELQDEALDYLIQVFTEDERNSASDLHQFLVGIGGERYAERVLHRLSRTFFDQARYARAIEAYRMLLAMAPNDPSAPESVRLIAAAYAALEDSEHTLATLLELAKNYGENSAWAKNQLDPSVVQKALAASERALRAQALRYHERAQHEGQGADFEHAVQLYRAYLSAFPTSPENYAVTFYLAEILFHRLGQPQAAGEYYLQAARAKPDGKYSKDALYNAIVAFESVRSRELEGCKQGQGRPASEAKKGEAAKPAAAAPATAASPSAAQPPTTVDDDPCRENATDQKFTEAVTLYVTRYPNDPELPAILFRQGRLYFDRGVFDPAIRHFGQLLDSYPRSEYAASAGEMVLESFNRADDYGNIELWARKLKNAPAFQQPESQKKLNALIVRAVWKRGEQLAQKGEHAQAAQAYLRATAEFPSDERAPQAYYNAGLEWQRAGDLEAAAAAYDALIEHHPGTTEGALGAWTGAQMFESIAQFQDAARYYEAYAARFPQGPKREDAFYNALVLRVAAGDDDRAVQDGLAYLKARPSGGNADEVYMLIGKAYEAKQRWAEAADNYRHYLKAGKQPERSIEAQTRLGKALSAQGQHDVADHAFTTAAKAGRKLESAGGRYYAAEARFLQGDRALAQFARVEIAGDVAGLRKRLAQKSDLLRKAAEIYADVVDYRVSEWVTAALYKIGQSYELFAESLRKAPIPSGLSEQEEQTYRDELAKFIVPIEERALEAYEGGYRKALELHVFNDWTQKQREGLTRLNDVEYPPLKEAGAGLAEAQLLPVPAPLDGLRRTSGSPATQGANAAQPANAPHSQPANATTATTRPSGQVKAKAKIKPKASQGAGVVKRGS
jgi:TolA-binding protein